MLLTMEHVVGVSIGRIAAESFRDKAAAAAAAADADTCCFSSLCCGPSARLQCAVVELEI